jgi:hypothetical protein
MDIVDGSQGEEMTEKMLEIKILCTLPQAIDIAYNIMLMPLSVKKIEMIETTEKDWQPLCCRAGGEKFDWTKCCEECPYSKRCQEIDMEIVRKGDLSCPTKKPSVKKVKRE